MEITSKDRMYALLVGGRLGNTTPQFFSLEKWEASLEYGRYGVWGIRTLIPGGPSRMYCPRDEVRPTVLAPEYQKAGFNISPMIDVLVNVTLWADVYETPEGGFVVYCIEHPGKGAVWRKEMPVRGKQYEGLAAKMILRKHMSPSSLADLEALLEEFPGHVVEFSCCDRNFGTIPGRNTVVWECRKY